MPVLCPFMLMILLNEGVYEVSILTCDQSKHCIEQIKLCIKNSERESLPPSPFLSL